MPLVYIFEETRNILVNGIVSYENIRIALSLNAFYFTVAIATFYFSFDKAREKGTLINTESKWCACKESNPEPPEPKSGALSS